MYTGRLRDAIQSAADQAGASANSSSSSTASDRDRGPSAKHLKPIVTAVEMVFGSAAALSATFGFKVMFKRGLLPVTLTESLGCTVLQPCLSAGCPFACVVAEACW